MTSKAKKIDSVKVWVRSLEKWYERAHRKLPWRESHDPYRIWISEVMLQQTQVATVIPYYANFLSKFPNVDALAKSEEQKVLTAWSGLGYYSRARNLRKGAEYIRNNFAGKFPQTRDEILKIPGIGPYTAGAILSIAYDLAVPIVDGNVQRVFARFYGHAGELQERKTQDFFWTKAREWVDHASSPRVLNQALMELGATVCTKANPKCDVCPLQKECAAFAKNLQSELPKKKRRQDTIELFWSPLYIEADGHVFLRKNTKGEWWTDLWDFPRCDSTDIDAHIKRLKATKLLELGICRHTVTHHRITARPVCVWLPRPRKIAEVEGHWHRLEDLERLPLSSLAKKVLRARESAKPVLK